MVEGISQSLKMLKACVTHWLTHARRTAWLVLIFTKKIDSLDNIYAKTGNSETTSLCDSLLHPEMIISDLFMVNTLGTCTLNSRTITAGPLNITEELENEVEDFLESCNEIYDKFQKSICKKSSIAQKETHSKWNRRESP